MVMNAQDGTTNLHPSILGSTVKPQFFVFVGTT